MKSNNVQAAEGQISITTEQLTASVDPAGGRISLTRADGTPLITGSAPAATVDGKTVSATDVCTSPKAARAQSSDPILRGPMLTANYAAPASPLAFDVSITLIEDRCACVIDMRVTNSGTTDAVIQASQPLRAEANANAGCFFGATAAGNRTRKAVTNGCIYYDPGELLDFAPGTTRELASFWNAAFHVPDTGETMVAAYLDNRDAIGRIHATWPDDAPPPARSFTLTATSQYNTHCVLRPGASLRSGSFVIALSPDPFSALEYFTETSARLNNVKLNPPINGWCTWFVYYGNYREEDVARHCEFIARELKPYGMDWVQIDDGYQTAFGNWQGPPAKFPRGMKGTADMIRSHGLKPGIWIAPYAISANTAIAREHAEWLAHDTSGALQAIEPAHQGQAQYILDITHPGARQWLHDLLHTITHDWGYDFVKTDFVEWTILATDRYHDPSMSKAMAYRLGCQVMRDAMGPDRHVLDCGPGPVAAGLIDSMRIELDRPVPENPLWDQYIGFHNSTAPAVAKRYAFHNRLWVNDADHIRLGGLTLTQARCAATITALSGGNMISSDRLIDLQPDRLDILRKIMPSFRKGARPLDLFESTSPTLFALPVTLPDRSWTIAALFNWEKMPTTRTLTLARLGIKAQPDTKHLAYEFWSQALVPVHDGSVTLHLDPESVALLAIHEDTKTPLVLGTDRHFSQGGVELSGVRWDAKTGTLSGTAHGAPGMKWTMAIHVPAGFAADPVRSRGVTLPDREPATPVLRAGVSFGEQDTQEWQIGFRAADRK